MDVVEGWTKLLYVAPESLTKAETIEFLKSVRVASGRMKPTASRSGGHDFRPEYRRIKPIVKGIADVPIMALTATATPSSTGHPKELEHGRCGCVSILPSTGTTSLRDSTQEGCLKQSCVTAFKTGKVASSTASAEKVEQIAETLRVNGVKALAYHAGMEVDSAAKSKTSS